MMNDFSVRVDALLDTVPEKEKLKLPYLKGNVDYAIADLVYDKRETKVAYESYYGQRDYREFKHLSDNYGVGSPVDIPNMRLMGTRIDYLVGKAMQNTFDYFVTCANTEAINLKNTEKVTTILKELQQKFEKGLQQPSKEKNPTYSEQFLKELKENFGDHWQASFEIAAQDMLTRLIDELALMEQSKDHIKDAFIAGECFNRVFVEEIGKAPGYWRCDPRDFFYEPNPNSPWIKDCRRVVYRQYIHPTQVLSKFGHLMKEEDRERIAIAISGYYDSRTAKEVLHYDDADGNDIAFSDHPNYHRDLIEVYHVEWVSTNIVSANTDVLDMVESTGIKNIKTKGKRLRVDRYEGYKIEQLGNIYFGLGKSKYIERSVSDPYSCTLSYNGRVLKAPRIDNRYHENRTPVSYRPFSFITATKDISDLYDITTMQLNQLMGAARPGGTITVLEHIPNFLGLTNEERIAKAAGYEKGFSTKLVSLSQEGTTPGEAGAVPFNNYGSYPANLDGSLIQAFVQYLQILEQQADSMLGLNARMKGEMEERDGKAATLNAIQQGDLFTKEIFRMHSAFMRQTLTRLLNCTRISYQNGFMGSVVLGKREKQFLIDPKTHSIADFNVYISDDVEEKQYQQKADEMVMLAVQNQVADLRLAFDTLTSRSITQKKQAVEHALKRREESAESQLQQLQQQMEEMQKQLEQVEKTKQQAESKLDQYKQKELQLKQQETMADIEATKKKLEIEEAKRKDKKETDSKKLQVELAQLHDSNKKNDAINWNR